LQVVGLTNEQEVLVIDQARPFRINEYLVINDPVLGFPKGEVVETQSFNRFLDFNLDKGVVGPETWRALMDSAQYDIHQHQVHIAKVRLLERVQTPVQPGTSVREPEFSEVRGFLVKGQPDKGLVLGVIHATDNLVPGMPADLRDRVKLLLDGQVQDQNGVPFIFDPRAMQQYPHIGIFGGSGSGKSFGLRVYLEELMKLRIPTLVLDPHFELTFSETPTGCPTGYRDIKFEERFRVFQVGQEVGIHFPHLNTRDLTRLLDASSGLTESMTSAVEALHKSNDSYATFSKRIDTLVDALEAGEKGADRRMRDPGGSGSEREVGADQVRVLGEFKGIPLSSVKGLQWRLQRLFRAGLFTNDIKPIESALKAGQLTVVQGPIWMLNVFSSYVVGTLYRQRREYKDAQFRRETAPYHPPFVVVTDEAHNFAPKAYDAPAKSIIKEIAQEGRKYGVFLILATQRPTLLDETVTAQLNTKCVFRTVRASDIATIKEETDLTQEEARRLPFLRSGDAFISSAIFGRTVPMRVRMAKTSSPHTENPFDELGEQAESEADTFLEIVGPILAGYGRVTDAMLIDVTRDLAKAGHSYTVDALRSRLDGLAEAGHVRKETIFGMSEYKLNV
jgi:DNA helicase HerA-like ATPase